MNGSQIKSVKAQLDAYNAQGVELFLAQYHDDVEITVLDSDMRISGKGEMRETYTKMFTENPNNRAEVLERWVLGDNIFDREIISDREGQAGKRCKQQHLIRSKLKCSAEPPPLADEKENICHLSLFSRPGFG